MSLTRSQIIEAAMNLNKRGVFAAKTNQIFICTYDRFFADLKKWAGNVRHRTNFVNDYKGYMIRILAIELCVILDKIDKRRDQYSIEALHKKMDEYIGQKPSNDILFEQPQEMYNAPEFLGFSYLKSGNIPPTLDDKIILDLFKKEKECFLANHAKDIELVKETRNKLLVHPDMDGDGELPVANFFIEVSEWCLAYCHLILNTLCASGVGLYTDLGRESCLGRVEKNYNQLLHELIGDK
jgi:hypothetical protein